MNVTNCRVERCLRDQGWVKLEDKASLNFTLKWVEVKQNIDYKNFREGEQLVNRFPNIQLLTTKIGLLESLRSYCKVYRYILPCTKSFTNPINAVNFRQKLERFLPETYRMDVASEREEFLKSFRGIQSDCVLCLIYLLRFRGGALDM